MTERVVACSIRFSTAVVCVVVATTLLAAADGDTVRRAGEMARQGDLAGAERLYDEAIEDDPGQLDAVLGRAFVRAWRGEHDAARRDFETVLDREPERLDARVGQGYNLAWSGDYEAARREFERALETAPDSDDAKKGLAYVALWEGDAETAARAFEAYRDDRPDSAEAAVGLGQARLAMGQQRRAREAFDDALDIEPTRLDARDGLNATRNFPPQIELSLWGGTTSGGGDSGLRLAEIAGWPTPRLRLWARYDDSLSLDNPVLSRTGESASAYLAGALFAFSDQWVARLELGRRDLDNDVDQDLYQGELVHARNRSLFKIGGFVGPRSDDATDRNIYVGYGRHIAPGWRIEPTVYYSRIGVAEDEEVRGILQAAFASRRGLTLDFGAGGGQVTSEVPEADGGLWTAYVTASYPVAFYHRVFVAVRHEDPPSGAFTVTSVGFALRMPRR